MPRPKNVKILLNFDVDEAEKWFDIYMRQQKLKGPTVFNNKPTKMTECEAVLKNALREYHFLEEIQDVVVAINNARADWHRVEVDLSVLKPSLLSDQGKEIFDIITNSTTFSKVPLGSHLIKKENEPFYLILSVTDSYGKVFKVLNSDTIAKYAMVLILAGYSLARIRVILKLKNYGDIIALEH